MKMENEAQPIVTGQLRMQGKEYNFLHYTWLSFMIAINEMMSEYKIEFPLGEDEKIAMVTKKVKETDKFR